MDEAATLIEAWKQSLAQKGRFDELIMKIRGLMMTLLAAILGIGGATSGWGQLSLAATTLLTVGAFYLMERCWYHQLLLGSVLHCSALEIRASEIGLLLPDTESHDADGVKRRRDNSASYNSLLGVTYRMSTELQRSWFGRRKAEFKVDLFYALIAAGGLLCVGLQRTP